MAGCRSTIAKLLKIDNGTVRLTLPDDLTYLWCARLHWLFPVNEPGRFVQPATRQSR